MKQIDLTTTLNKRKGSRVTYTTVYYNHKNIYAIKSSVGLGFVRFLKTKKQMQTTSNNQTKWYHSSSNSLVEALTDVRKWYNLKVRNTGWDKFRVKLYNTTETDELIKTLNGII